MTFSIFLQPRSKVFELFGNVNEQTFLQEHKVKAIHKISDRMFEGLEETLKKHIKNPYDLDQCNVMFKTNLDDKEYIAKVSLFATFSFNVRPISLVLETFKVYQLRFKHPRETIETTTLELSKHLFELPIIDLENADPKNEDIIKSTKWYRELTPTIKKTGCLSL